MASKSASWEAPEGVRGSSALGFSFFASLEASDRDESPSCRHQPDFPFVGQRAPPCLWRSARPWVGLISLAIPAGCCVKRPQFDAASFRVWQDDVDHAGEHDVAVDEVLRAASLEVGHRAGLAVRLRRSTILWSAAFACRFPPRESGRRVR